MAASNPVVALTSDGNTKTAELQLGLGATNIGGTWDPQSTGVSNNDFHLVIGGLYGRLSLQEDAQQIAPLVDLRLGFDNDAMAADFASPPPSTIAHETYALTLANPGAAAVMEEVPSTAAFSGGLKMVAGSLTVGAASVPGETVTVPTGKCLSTTSHRRRGRQRHPGKARRLRLPVAARPSLRSHAPPMHPLPLAGSGTGEARKRLRAAIDQLRGFNRGLGSLALTASAAQHPPVAAPGVW